MALLLSPFAKITANTDTDNTSNFHEASLAPPLQDAIPSGGTTAEYCYIRPSRLLQPITLQNLRLAQVMHMG